MFSSLNNAETLQAGLVRGSIVYFVLYAAMYREDGTLAARSYKRSELSDEMR